MALLAALGVAGCGDIEFGPGGGGGDGGGGDESGGEVCDENAGQSVSCIEADEAGECPDCRVVGCPELFDDGSGCYPDNPSITCGPMPANGMCCYWYTSHGMICDGRPLMVGGAARTAAVVARGDWASAGPRRGGPWAQRGLDEHASIAAFAKFVLELLAVGAPAELVADAAAAMRDEVEHARLCFGLAGDEVGPGPLATTDVRVAADLGTIASATLVEGAIGETLAAVRAATEAASEADPVVRGILERIAADETRHAALAWRFVRWAVQTDPQLRPTLERVLDEALVRVDGEVASAVLRPIWSIVRSSNDVATAGQNPSSAVW